MHSAEDKAIEFELHFVFPAWDNLERLAESKSHCFIQDFMSKSLERDLIRACTANEEFIASQDARSFLC